MKCLTSSSAALLICFSDVFGSPYVQSRLVKRIYVTAQMSNLNECYGRGSIMVFLFVAGTRWFLRLDHKRQKRAPVSLCRSHRKRWQQEKEDQRNNQKESS
jgi:hypothetical protein